MNHRREVRHSFASQLGRCLAACGFLLLIRGNLLSGYELCEHPSMFVNKESRESRK